MRADASAPVVLTAAPLLCARADLAQGLRNAQFELRFVADWDRMPEAAERIAADVVLVDMDAADAASQGTRGPSGFRLVRVLARQTNGRPVALVVITGLDYVEIEDLARAGITALLPPRLTAKALVTHLYAAVARARHKRGGRVLHRKPYVPSAEPPKRPEQSEQTEGESAPKASKPDDGWRIPDALWSRLQGLLPPPSPRARIADRQIMDGLFFLLRTRLVPSALPMGLGSPSTVRRRLRAWQEACVFERLAAVACDTHPHLHWERLPELVARMGMA
jgi:transposase